MSPERNETHDVSGLFLRSIGEWCAETQILDELWFMCDGE